MLLIQYLIEQLLHEQKTNPEDTKTVLMVI